MAISIQSFQDFHRAYLRHFDATASIDDGYVDDAGLIAYAAAIEHQFGLICDWPACPATSFPKGMTGPEGSIRRRRNDEAAFQ